MKNKSFIIFSHLEKSDNLPGESSPPLNLFYPLKKRQKPQISSIPGISPKERNRYRVMLADEILGDYLSIDKALELAARRGEQ